MPGPDFRRGIAAFDAEYFRAVSAGRKGTDAVVINEHHPLAMAAAQQQDSQTLPQ